MMSQEKPLNPWNYKPWWCQPWSILLTGLTIIGASWLLFHRLWVSAIVALPICTWMGFFLLIWPKLMIKSGILEQYHLPESE
jgi:hypothetical protein